MIKHAKINKMSTSVGDPCGGGGGHYLFPGILTFNYFQTGSKVPVIMPKVVMKALAYLANPKIRGRLHIKTTNMYLFANKGIYSLCINAHGSVTCKHVNYI